MICLYYIHGYPLTHIALSASGLGRRSFSISFYASDFLYFSDFVASPGKWRPVEYDLMDSDCMDVIYIPTQEDGNLLGISEEAIYNWVESFKRERPLFTGLNNNCSGVVVKALRAGLTPLIENLHVSQQYRDALLRYQQQSFLLPLPLAVFNLGRAISQEINRVTANPRYGADYFTGSSAQAYTDNSDVKTQMNLLLTSALRKIPPYSGTDTRIKKYIHGLRSQIDILNKEKLDLSAAFCAKFFQLIAYVEEGKSKFETDHDLYLMLQRVRDLLQEAHEHYEVDFNSKTKDALRCIRN